MTKFRQLPNLGSSFSHYSRCEFTGNGRDPYLVGLEGCQIWAPLRGGNLGLGRISSKSILNLGGNLGSIWCPLSVDFFELASKKVLLESLSRRLSSSEVQTRTCESAGRDDDV